MKKDLIKRLSIGSVIGIVIYFLITIINSLLIGDGNYYPVPMPLLERGELNGVILQVIFSALYGAVWGLASLIWETDWNLLKMSITHFAVMSLVTLPFAYFMHWVNHDFISVLIYFAIFIAIYFMIWLCLYFATKCKIKAINNSI